MSDNKNMKKRGFFAEMVYSNPVFGLYLGICSALAVTTTLNNALGMGLCVIVVLVASNIIISLIARITPEDIHIPVYIVIIATLVTLVSMLLQAFAPELFNALGAFVDLIVVNCIILGRAEAYACDHTVGESAKDGIMMGLAYTFSIVAMSLIRQILGTGVLSLTNPLNNATIFSLRLIPEGFEIPVFTSQTGAFLTFAILAALVTAYKNHNDAKEQAAIKAAAKGAK
ncbi:MAG: electron transport complex subunit RsxE [Erysipelotrichia bacterium]|nr:electron transport complex subunit RsxE [Erysipelotrichia bacterium]